ncbi:S-layer homology domain-containing protein [Paenibacillus gansuensis]|uniref:S-layer homology domain-containing protein n=1 Tax=Paenibacillus gansuensis TaxID=306542 RepID=A0ABW5PF77_9BACL
MVNKGKQNLKKAFRRETTLFNKALLKKTSGVLAFLMLLTALAPVLAFAATGFKDDVKYDTVTNKVSGTVYYTDGDVSVGQSVYVNVYDENKNVLGVVYASKVGDSVYGNTYYAFNDVIKTPNTGKILLNPFIWKTVDESVYSDVYKEISVTNNNGGGGIIIIPPTAPGTIVVTDNVTSSELTNAFKNGVTKVTVKFSGDSVTLPVDALKEAAKIPGATLVVTNANGSYILPLAALDFNALAKKLGEDLKSIKVTIKKLSDADAKAGLDAATAQGLKAASALVDFNIAAVGATKTADVTSFGKTYVKRTIAITSGTAKSATVVRWDAAAKKWVFVPSTIGTTEATFQRTGNSVYAVVTANKTFSDLAKHWSKAEVEVLANKLVVEGVAADTFAPNRNITRAEFAALVVRSLGLDSVTTNTYGVAANTYSFTDVVAGKWYSADVTSAAATGIIVGDGKGKFKPDALITRQELAAMVVRAMAYAGKEVKLTGAEQASALASFTDAKKLTWAKAEVAVAVKSGVVLGSNNKISPTANATRAEAASMLKRFLTNVGFIE